MQRVTLKFSSLQALGDCLYKLGVEKPAIDYYEYSFKANLTEEQIETAKDCGAEVLNDRSDTVIPE